MIALRPERRVYERRGSYTGLYIKRKAPAFAPGLWERWSALPLGSSLHLGRSAALPRRRTAALLAQKLHKGLALLLLLLLHFHWAGMAPWRGAPLLDGFGNWLSALNARWHRVSLMCSPPHLARPFDKRRVNKKAPCGVSLASGDTATLYTMCGFCQPFAAP